MSLSDIPPPQPALESPATTAAKMSLEVTILVRSGEQDLEYPKHTSSQSWPAAPIFQPFAGVYVGDGVGVSETTYVQIPGVNVVSHTEALVGPH
jgi:hypothetical protein